MSAQSEAGTILNFHRSFAAALVALSFFGGGSARADWVSSAKSQARLVDGGMIDGVRTAGAQIRLDGAAVTYWRDPGEAGAPPVFDFAGSDNIAAAKVLYPQPQRIDEAGVQAFGYQHEVVFPIRVTPRDKSRPAILALKLDYAVCETICLPVHAQLRLDLPPQPPDGEGATLVADALKQVPKPLDAAEAKNLAAVTPATSADGKPRWLLQSLRPDARDIFVESPPGFYFETRAATEKGEFLLILADHPAGEPTPGAPVQITVTGDAPAQFDLALPPRP